MVIHVTQNTAQQREKQALLRKKHAEAEKAFDELMYLAGDGEHRDVKNKRKFKPEEDILKKFRILGLWNEEDGYVDPWGNDVNPTFRSLYEQYEYPLSLWAEICDRRQYLDPSCLDDDYLLETDIKQTVNEARYYFKLLNKELDRLIKEKQTKRQSEFDERLDNAHGLRRAKLAQHPHKLYAHKTTPKRKTCGIRCLENSVRRMF